MAKPEKDPANFRPWMAFKGPVPAVAGAVNAAIREDLVRADDVEIRVDGSDVILFGNPRLRGKMPRALGFIEGFALAKGAKFDPSF